MNIIRSTYLLAGMFLSTLSAFSQCTPDYDFGEEEFGISPDVANGEQLEEGVINQMYTDVIQVKVPTNGGAFSDAGALFNVDSVTFVGLTLIDEMGQTYSLDEIGLELECNNDGMSPNACTFIGGQQGCATLQGTPTVAGTFSTEIDALVYLSSPIINTVLDELPPTDLQLVIQNPDNIENQSTVKLRMGQNSPNPAVKETTVAFTSNLSGQATLEVVNLVGQSVFKETKLVRQGGNSFLIDVSVMPEGLYMYSVLIGGQQITKRMVINR